jgi:hypothetical protein
MRYRSIGLLVLLCESLLGQIPATEASAAAATLTVALASDHSVSERVTRAMQREVESALAPSGVVLNWKGSNSLNSEVFERLARVRLRGSCRLDAPISSSLRIDRRNIEALGQTQVVDGKVLPIADVQCDLIRKLIDRDLRIIPASEQDELLGRALGRVMAHELYHVLLRTRAHGHSGLARPAQNSAELLAPRNTFAGEEERKLAQSEAIADAGSNADSDR